MSDTIIAPEATGLVHVRHNTNYNIAPDAFVGVISALSSDQQEILSFWYFLGKERDWSLTKLAKACGVSSTTLSRVFRGDYGADVSKLCETLAKAKDNFAESVDNPDFIQTSLSKPMFEIFDRTRALRSISFMSGKMGTGKSTVSLEYKRLNNHGRTTYYRCEPGLTFVQFITEVARANGVSHKKQTHLRLREKLYTVHGAGARLFIIDEFHQLFLRREKKDVTPVMQCEFIRALFDLSGGAISIVSTNALKQHLLDNTDALSQLIDRGMEFELPDEPTSQDVQKFIKHFGLPQLTANQPEASSIIADIVKSSGLRKLTTHLKDGAATAAKRQERYTWNHFVDTFVDFKSLGKRRK